MLGSFAVKLGDFLNGQFLSLRPTFQKCGSLKSVTLPILICLQIAARSVSHATSLLVAAARAASVKDEKEPDEDYSKLSATGYKVKEMEQTMQILRLEKELEKSRKALVCF